MARPRRPLRQRAVPAAGSRLSTSHVERSGPALPPPSRSDDPDDLRRLSRSADRGRSGRCAPASAPISTEGPSVLRTHEAGTLRAAHTGQTVTLAGWVAKRRDHGGVAFLDVRDASGVVQVVARDEVLTGAAHDLRNEFVVTVVGQVAAREERNVNPDLAHRGGRGRRDASSRCSTPRPPLPFQVDERVTVGEEARLKHRYLDLRRPGRHPPVTRSGSAPRSTPRPAGCSARATSSRSRPRRSPAPPRRARVTSSCPPGSRPAAGTRCRRARSCSSSSSWWPAWSATTRSRAATGTRTSAPTASRSSPSSTSR